MRANAEFRAGQVLQVCFCLKSVHTSVPLHRFHFQTPPILPRAAFYLLAFLTVIPFRNGYLSLAKLGE